MSIRPREGESMGTKPAWKIIPVNALEQEGVGRVCSLDEKLNQDFLRAEGKKMGFLF